MPHLIDHLLLFLDVSINNFSISTSSIVSTAILALNASFAIARFSFLNATVFMSMFLLLASSIFALTLANAFFLPASCLLLVYVYSISRVFNFFFSCLVTFSFSLDAFAVTLVSFSATLVAFNVFSSSVLVGIVDIVFSSAVMSVV